jgi:hypothetical protein
MLTLSLLDFRLSVIDALPVIRMIPKVLSVTDDEWCFLRLAASVNVGEQSGKRKPTVKWVDFSIAIM